jgi:hypothetical protein
VRSPGSGVTALTHPALPGSRGTTSVIHPLADACLVGLLTVGPAAGRQLTDSRCSLSPA